jgi:hypothetical protein
MPLHGDAALAFVRKKAIQGKCRRSSPQRSSSTRISTLAGAENDK